MQNSKFNNEALIFWLSILFFILAAACVACFFIFKHQRWVYLTCGFLAFGVRIIIGIIKRRINN